MNPLDLPMPPPESKATLTIAEMVGHITDYFVLNAGMDFEVAQEIAQRGTSYLIETGMFEEWGVAQTGEVVYAPIKPLPRVFVWVKT